MHNDMAQGIAKGVIFVHDTNGDTARIVFAVRYLLIVINIATACDIRLRRDPLSDRLACLEFSQFSRFRARDNYINTSQSDERALGRIRGINRQFAGRSEASHAGDSSA